ncbi:MFS transporter [Pedobacter frigoris]|uniref:MFS transporter n=1 Tax=Pedobacter frigoris TaxID=2571272 RepID=UPI00292E359A|nr:MFS transporter [Pedobacter frigoris]
MAKKFRNQQWVMLLICMLCYLFFYTGRHNFGWAVKDMSKELNIGYAQVGWISFSMLIGYAVGQFINGNLADRFSARFMVVTGAYLSVCMNIAISFSQSAGLIMIFWAFNGYFQSMAWAPSSKVISNWWSKEEKGKAFGLFTMSAGLSSAVTYLLSIVMIQQHMEWRMLFRLPVLLLLVVATIYLWVIRDKPSLLGFQEFEENRSEPSAPKEDWVRRYKVVFNNKGFMMASLSFAFESMARYGLIFWVPVHYLGENWKANPSYLWVTFLLPIGMATGALSFGILSDSLFKRNRIASIRFGMLISAGLALLIYLLPAENIIVGAVLMFFVGFFVYGPQANFWTLSPEMLGNKYTGTGIGLMNMCGYVFAALGEPMFGHVIDLLGNSDVIFIIVSVICLLSAIVISLVKVNKMPYLTKIPVS